MFDSDGLAVSARRRVARSARVRCGTAVLSPGRMSPATGDPLGCSHQLVLGVTSQPWDSRSV